MLAIATWGFALLAWSSTARHGSHVEVEASLLEGHQFGTRSVGADTRQFV
jgi:hypothetical protein